MKDIKKVSSNIPYQIWGPVLDKFSISKVIGKGKFGTVSKAQCRKTGLVVAIKMIEKFKNNEYKFV